MKEDDISLDYQIGSEISQKSNLEKYMEEEYIPTIEESRRASLPDVLDEHFRESGFEIEKPNENYENTSWRRITHPDGRVWDVAYKTDWRIHDTGKIFIETWSTWNKGKGRPGWAKDKRFNAIVIYSPQGGYLWWIPSKFFQKYLEEWAQTYGTHEILNKSWVTLGIAVPEEIFHKQLPKSAHQYLKK